MFKRPLVPALTVEGKIRQYLQKFPDHLVVLTDLSSEEYIQIAFRFTRWGRLVIDHVVTDAIQTRLEPDDDNNFVWRYDNIKMSHEIYFGQLVLVVGFPITIPSPRSAKFLGVRRDAAQLLRPNLWQEYSAT